MRTIKFRVWNPDDLKMEFPLVFSICMSGELQPLIKCSDGNRAYKDYPINQFIGLTDKNSIEIYENDIVRKHNYRNGAEKIEDYIVVFDYGGFCLKTIKDNEIHDKGTLISFGNFEGNGNLRKEEIVGNVYENPELL